MVDIPFSLLRFCLLLNKIIGVGLIGLTACIDLIEDDHVWYFADKLG
jgi:hypothetical protein